MHRARPVVHQHQQQMFSQFAYSIRPTKNLLSLLDRSPWAIEFANQFLELFVLDSYDFL